MNNPSSNENILHFPQAAAHLRNEFSQNLLGNANNQHSDSSKGEQSNYKTGRWNNTEHMRFIQGCLLHGNNWRKVKDCVKTRSSAQIRSHAQKYLIKLCKKYKIQDNKDGKTSKAVRNKKKLKNDLSDEFIIDHTILEQNPSLINIQDVEQKILKIFKSNLTSNLSKDDSMKFEDNASDDSQGIMQRNNNNNSANSGKLFETFKISKKNKNKQQKMKPGLNPAMDYNNMNNYLMNNNMPNTMFDPYMMTANFQTPKGINPNMLQLFGMPMENNPGAINNDLLGLLFQQYQQNANNFMEGNIPFPIAHMVDNQPGLGGLPMGINLMNFPGVNPVDALGNNSLNNYSMMFNPNQAKGPGDIENILKMIQNGQSIVPNEPDHTEQPPKTNPVPSLNNVMSAGSIGDNKNNFLGQKKQSGYAFTDPNFLYEGAELQGENKDPNNMNLGQNNFGGFEFSNIFGFDKNFLQGNTNFNMGMGGMNPLLNEKMIKNEFTGMDPLNFNQGFEQPVKREEAEPAEQKNCFDINQLLGADQSMFFNFQPPSGTNNPNMLFENFLMNMNMCNPNNTAGQAQMGNMFDFENSTKQAANGNGSMNNVNNGNNQNCSNNGN